MRRAGELACAGCNSSGIARDAPAAETVVSVPRGMRSTAAPALGARQRLGRHRLECESPVGLTQWARRIEGMVRLPTDAPAAACMPNRRAGDYRVAAAALSPWHQASV